MQRTYQNNLDKVLNSLKEEYKNIVIACCKQMPDETISFGNTRIALRNEVPYLGIAVHDTNDFIELFGENGYPEIEDMAHWADVCEDFINSRNAGNTSYSVTWNISSKS